IAVLGAIFEHEIGTRLHAVAPHAPAGLAAAVAAKGPAAAPGGGVLAAAARQAFLAGLRDILLVGAAIAFTGAVAAVALIRARDFHRAHMASDAPVAAGDV